MHCQRDDIAATATHLSQCGVDIDHCMAANRLQMNPAKTELLWAGTKHNVSLLGCHAQTLQLGSDIVTPSPDYEMVTPIVMFVFWELPFRRI